MRIPVPPVLLAASLILAGCHSPSILTTIDNRTTQPLSLIEVDYPSASFGTQTLAPGATYRYRFQVLGDGGTTLLWTDAAHHDHKTSGPALRQGDEGSLTIIFPAGAAPTWDLSLVNRPAGS